MLTFMKSGVSWLVTAAKAVGTFVVGLGTSALALVSLAPVAVESSTAADLGAAIVAVESSTVVEAGAGGATAMMASPPAYYLLCALVVACGALIIVSFVHTCIRRIRATMKAKVKSCVWDTIKSTVSFPVEVVMDTGRKATAIVEKTVGVGCRTVVALWHGARWTYRKISDGGMWAVAKCRSNSGSDLMKSLLNETLANDPAFQKMDPELVAALSAPKLSPA